MAQHLSIFVENKPGQLERITKVLADNAVNVRAFSVASAGEFGVVKVLVNDPVKALAALKEKHFTVSSRRILIALVDDKPGGLYQFLTTLSANRINVEDCYGFVLEDKKMAAIVVEVEKFPEAETVLRSKGIRLLADDDIYSL
jgi:hypothetical protein